MIFLTDTDDTIDVRLIDAEFAFGPSCDDVVGGSRPDFRVDPHGDAPALEFVPEVHEGRQCPYIESDA